MSPIGHAKEYAEYVENMLVIHAVRSGDRFRQWLYIGNYAVNPQAMQEALEHRADGLSALQARDKIIADHS